MCVCMYFGVKRDHFGILLIRKKKKIVLYNKTLIIKIFKADVWERITKFITQILSGILAADNLTHRIVVEFEIVFENSRYICRFSIPSIINQNAKTKDFTKSLSLFLFRIPIDIETNLPVNEPTICKLLCFYLCTKKS